MGRKIFTKASIALSALIMASVNAAGQVRDIGSALGSVKTTVRGVFEPLADIMSFIIGVIGLLLLAPAFARYNKGDHTSADSFMKWAAGMLMAYIGIQAISLIVF